MPLDMPDGTACFVDSNIFYYALITTTDVTVPCKIAMNRAIAGKLALLTTVSVLSDTVHKVMTAEASMISGRNRPGIVGYLGKHPDIISKLVEYPLAMDRIGRIPMTILPVDDQLLRRATQLAVKHQILTNDALILAHMEHSNLTHLVTNDSDFDSIPGITVWKPR